ncbi:amino acid ABC transporter permease [Clostridium septicum]|uniref:amino acid ABC transporter permease n=1 Tax=Clostridium septicum TaxID=1504 RepID=UPI001146FE78|nr:amino acid ABC transporter permease [Clostridium septicum]
MLNLDFSFVSKYLPVFIDGAKITLVISFITVLFGVLFGSVLFFMKSSNIHIGKFKPLKIIASIYIEIVRGTPMLLQILMVYSGSKMIFGIDISAFASAVIAISLNSAAYVSEIVRAGIEAVDKGQLEAARSLGMTQAMAMRLVGIPQAVRNILPAIGNEFVTIIKESSMASVIGVGELMFSAKVVTGATYLGFEPLIIAAVFYFIMTFSLGRLMSYIERRLKVSDSR